MNLARKSAATSHSRRSDRVSPHDPTAKRARNAASEGRSAEFAAADYALSAIPQLVSCTKVAEGYHDRKK